MPRVIQKHISQKRFNLASHRGPDRFSSDPYSYRKKSGFPRCDGVGYIAKQKYARISGIASLSFLIILLTLAVCPVILRDSGAEAAGAPVASDVSLDMTSGYVLASVNIIPTDINGNFAKSSDANKAKFEVKTNNYTGYTLSIAAADDTGLLTNTDTTITSGNTLSSITAPITEATFNTASYNNHWGMMPNKYVVGGTAVIDNTVYQNFLPSPTTAGTTLNITDGPNKTSEDTYSTDMSELVADNYEIGLGARVDYGKAAGTYAKTFQLMAVANPVSFAINFDQTTGDVANMPGPLAPTSTTGAVTSITLPSSTPTRPGYTFKAWCEGTVGGTTANPATTCTGTEYNAGDTYYLDQTTTNITTLYATWTPNTYSITATLNTGVTSIKVCIVTGDCSGANLKGTISTTGGSVSGLTYNNAYYLYPAFQNTAAGKYYFNSWSIGAGSAGTLSSTSTANTTFTIGQGNGAIIATASPTTFNDAYSGKTQTSGYYQMKDMTATMCANVVNGQTSTLIDTRDNKTYKVAKINGNCWMTENLRFGYDSTNAADGTAVSLTLSTTDSNVTSNKTIKPYDLVNYGGSGKQCYGTYDSSTGTGTGSGYTTACIHSGVTEHSGGQTVWYNYTLASAGTITGTNNTTTATQSICPKGWTLPSKTQIDSLSGGSSSTTYVGSFSPVLGGGYTNGTLYNESTHGLWWGSTAYNGAERYFLGYNGSSLYTYNGRRYNGRYVRCVQAS